MSHTHSPLHIRITHLLATVCSVGVLFRYVMILTCTDFMRGGKFNGQNDARCAQFSGSSGSGGLPVRARE